MKKLWPFILLAIIILLFLGRGLSNDMVFFGADEIGSDLLHGVYTQRQYLAEYIKQGQLPLWLPYIASGIPIEPQIGLYAPLVLILYRFLSVALAFNLSIILNFLLMALGIYLYSRKIGLEKLPALFAGIIFTLSGFMVGHLRHVSLESAAVIFPYLLITLEEIIIRKKFFWAIILSFLLFYSLGYGHIPTTYFIFAFGFVYFLLRLSQQFKEEGGENIKPIFIFLTGLLFGLLLSSAILIPIFEQIKYSTRAVFGMENSLSPPFKLQFFLMFILPYVFGDPSRGTWNIYTESFWENIGYIGIIPLILAFLSLFVFRQQNKKWRTVLIFFCIGSLVFLLGSWTPFYNLAWNWVPGFSFTRAPGRFLFYLDFALAILAGFGLQNLLSKYKNKKIWLGGGIVAITLVDLFFFGYHFNTVISTKYFAETESVQFLKQDPDLYRIRSLGVAEAWQEAWEKAHGWTGDLSPYFKHRELVPEDDNIVYKISTPTILYGLAGRFTLKKPSELDATILSQLESSQSARLLGMENVKYLLSFEKIKSNSDFKLVKEIPTEDKNVYIYQNPQWLPRAYFVTKAIDVPSPEAMLNIITSGIFNPKEEVLLEQKIGNPNRGGKGEVKIISYQDAQIVLEADSLNGGFLVLSDSYYPGWKALVDNQEKPILQANYNYRALELEPGFHRIIFSYQPQSVKLGQIISVSFLVIVLIAGVVFWKKRL